MAKRKSLRKNYSGSKGERNNVARSTVNATRVAYMASGQRIANQFKAFKQGKNVVLTIVNPNKNETNKPFIRVNAKTVWKLPKKVKVQY